MKEGEPWVFLPHSHCMHSFWDREWGRVAVKSFRIWDFWDRHYKLCVCVGPAGWVWTCLHTPHKPPTTTLPPSLFFAFLCACRVLCASFTRFLPPNILLPIPTLLFSKQHACHGILPDSLPSSLVTSLSVGSNWDSLHLPQAWHGPFFPPATAAFQLWFFVILPSYIV